MVKSQEVLCFLPGQQGCQIGLMLSSPINTPDTAKVMKKKQL